MILRWIYSLWNFLLKTVAYLLLFIVLLAGLSLAALQLPASKDHLKVQLEDTFDMQFAGTVEIESIRGFIPFRTQFNNVVFYSPEYPFEKQLSAETIIASVDLWGLIRGNIKITALELNRPSLLLTQNESGLLLAGIFETESDSEVSTRRNADQFFNQFSIFAPDITISNGRLEADESITFPEQFAITPPFIVSELNAEFFLESNDDQQFLDITSFSALTTAPGLSEIMMNGQFFNDGHFLELNGLEFKSDQLTVELTAEASPVNLYSQNFIEQLYSAGYRLEIQRLYIQPELLKRINAGFSQINYPLYLEGIAEGDIDELFLDNFQITTGDSFLLADGLLSDLRGSEFSYDLLVNNLVITEQDITPFFPGSRLEDLDFSPYGTPTLRGELRGSLQEFNTQLQLYSDIGSARIDAGYIFGKTATYDLRVDFDSLDVSPILKDSLGTSVIHGQVMANGSGMNEWATVETFIDLSNSRFLGHTFEIIQADANYENRNGSYSLQLKNHDTDGSASGNFMIAEDRSQFSIDAAVRQLDITTYFPNLNYEQTSFNGRVSANLEGNSPEDLFGRISLEVNESIINGDTLRAHQLYADIDQPGGESRTLRLTSSFFDAELSGTIYPELLRSTADYWYTFLSNQIKEDLLFQETSDVRFSEISFPAQRSPVDLSLRATAKDLQLLKSYFPEIGSITSSATLNININAASDALSLNGSFFDDSLTVNQSAFNDLGMSFTGAFSYGEPLRNSSLVDLQINSPDFIIGNGYSISGASVNLSLRDSSITVRQEVENALENLFFFSETTTRLYSDRLETTVDTLSTGSPDYKWYSAGLSEIIYNRDKSLTFNQFILESENDYFELNGTFSDAPEDSVNYNIHNFSLARISDLIGGRIQFEGIVDGEFTTRALTQIPSIQGDLSVRDGRINGRIVGDVSLKSRFNSDEDRFDTEIHLYTDPERYADYLERNNGTGQDLFLSGYFKAPDDIIDEEEDLFYFDADLREIDMWIVSFIVPNIITEMEGSSSGRGFIRGSRNDYNFEAEFDIDDVYGRPTFTNVPYTLSGNLEFNRSDGLLFNSIAMDDGQGGRGTLSGQIDLNDFSPPTSFSLTLELDELRFMNNVQDPNVPFYADLYGSGTAVLSGTSDAPEIRSTTPIYLSTRSRISIPLQEETELEQDRRFIQFVESFENLTPMQSAYGRDENGDRNGSDEIDLTFVELFSMNLLFVANDPVNVRLIFDPVTNDILTATGTGQIRLILEDQDFSMFGRFNISGGEYQFVGGDIFTRRFNIQDGGSISWQGDLADANLNVTASYRARPDISTLLPAGATFQRVPVELILQIGGTISEISNEFHFQVPTGIEGTQDPTIAAQINRLNQNEDEKVLQAFGILLTGNFVPSDLLQNPEAGNVSGTNALVNPLVSSQIISPLLSNQINSLLRSDITFDVDFNLNAFNEVDLGVALRLFNDRIVLRREGQITGDTEIGDLGATYRINRIFSITAFHRQDPTLSNRAETDARQTQEMNGMGLEAQFQFNTWQSLRNRISNSLRNLFGLKEKESDVEDEESDSLAQN